MHNLITTFYFTELEKIQEWFLITEEGIKNVKEQH